MGQFPSVGLTLTWKLSDAQSTQWCINMLWKRSWTSCRSRSQCFLIPRGLFTEDIYHGTIMIYDTKTISCTIRATWYVLENKTQLSWQLWNKARHQVTALPHVRSAYLFFFLSFSFVSSANRFGKHDRCVRGAHLWDSDCVLDTVCWKILAQKGNQEVEFEQDGHKVCNNVGMMT